MLDEIISQDVHLKNYNTNIAIHTRHHHKNNERVIETLRHPRKL